MLRRARLVAAASCSSEYGSKTLSVISLELRRGRRRLQGDYRNRSNVDQTPPDAAAEGCDDLDASGRGWVAGLERKGNSGLTAASAPCHSLKVHVTVCIPDINVQTQP